MISENNGRYAPPLQANSDKSETEKHRKEATQFESVWAPALDTLLRPQPWAGRCLCRHSANDYAVTSSQLLQSRRCELSRILCCDGAS